MLKITVLVIVVLIGVIVFLSNRIKKLRSGDTPKEVWFIIEPKQIMRRDYKAILSTIRGPFFSEASLYNYTTANNLPEDSGVVSWKLPVRLNKID